MQPAWCCRMLKSQWQRGMTRLHLEEQKQCKLHGMLPEQTAALMSRDGMANVMSVLFQIAAERPRPPACHRCLATVMVPSALERACPAYPPYVARCCQ